MDVILHQLSSCFNGANCSYNNVYCRENRSNDDLNDLESGLIKLQFNDLSALAMLRDNDVRDLIIEHPKIKTFVKEKPILVPQLLRGIHYLQQNCNNNNNNNNSNNSNNNFGQSIQSIQPSVQPSMQSSISHSSLISAQSMQSSSIQSFHSPPIFNLS